MATKKTESSNIYRIMDFNRVVEIFTKKQLHFAHPSTWDDKFETQLQHRDSNRFFCQCWTTTSMSDAMWRIYSQNFMGVRISTTRQKLERSIIDEHQISYVKDVKYLKAEEHGKEIARISSDLRARHSAKRAADALFYKRNAFDHETECRAVVVCDKADEDDVKDGIKINVDPHDLILSIYLDPRAPQPLVDAFTYYFQNKLKFKGTVRRSTLYRVPRPEVVDDVFDL